MSIIEVEALVKAYDGTNVVDGVSFAVEEGEVFGISVPGTLTIKDISQDITVDLEAARSGENVVVVGTWPIEFGDFDVTMPSAPIVVSVSEDGDLEWQVFFTQAGDMADDDT